MLTAVKFIVKLVVFCFVSSQLKLQVTVA